MIRMNNKVVRDLYCYKHFAKRLAERYNLFISFGEYKELTKAEPLFTLSRNTKRPHASINVLTIKGTPVVVVMDYQVGRMITALPFSVWKKVSAKEYYRKRQKSGQKLKN